MGLLEGRKALVFGVANDHSIAWGIAKAFHDQGAIVGFSSVESSDRAARPAPRGRPSAAPSSNPRTPSRTPTSSASWTAGRRRYGEIDILVHAVAYAKREDLDGSFVDTSRDGFAVRDRRLRLLAGRHGPRRPAATPPRQLDPDAHLPRRREGRDQLQRDGRRQGGARGDGPLPRRRPRARGHPRQRDLRGPDPDAVGGRHRGTSASSTARSTRSPRCAPTSRSRTSATPRRSSRPTWRAPITGRDHFVDGGFNIIGVPSLD